MTDLRVTPVAKKRSDYQQPDFLIDQVDMTFWLEPNETIVLTQTIIRRNGEHDRELILDGEQLELIDVQLNAQPFSDYAVVDGKLKLNISEQNFTLEIKTKIDPANNTSLEGLYASNGTFCTQCEAEGFRKITYFLDRPDVLATYSVTIHADKARFPFLLSNGNCLGKGEGEGENGTHWVKWHDPFKKPCYLFALVAGDFDLVEDQFITCSGKAVQLQIFVDKGNAYRSGHALDSLKKAMRWDEDVFGLEYDLDIFMIVAVDFFNMGAMENKGLNVFNSKCVLADPESATDEDYFNIESIVAHEYFHNWTGNRVTCRDWFQLSLKEGLTVFRDQQFSSDMSSPVINRIRQVKVMREHQFAEDAGPMSHPIRPDEVIEMNNFYTVTVYDKGAEVIRMLYTMLGKDGFRAGMDLYFARHDGQAVTCDDFVAALQDATNVDLSLFKRWYSQSGTPEVTVSEQHSAEAQTFKLTLKQNTPATADQSQKQDLHIPIDMMLLAPNGEPEPIDANGNVSTVLNLQQSEQTFEFFGIAEKPVVDIFRSFSAPVKVQYEQSIEELTSIALNAEDNFSRWEACQKIYSDAIFAGNANNGKVPEDKKQKIVENLRCMLQNKPKDLALLAELLIVPTFDSLSQMMTSVNVDSLLTSRFDLQNHIALNLSNDLLNEYHALPSIPFEYTQNQVANRQFKNMCLYYIAHTEQHKELLFKQYHSADNMTDSLGVLRAAQKYNLPVFEELMADFEAKWREDVLVLDKWFALHAGLEAEDILARLSLLTSHAQYNTSNPNRVRAVVGTFAFYNTVGFHKLDGSGYKFLADSVIQLNKINPQVASRIITPLNQWNRYVGDERQDLMKAQLMRIANEPDLSPDLYEKVSKALHF